MQNNSGFLYNGQGKRRLKTPRKRPSENISYKNITGNTAVSLFSMSEGFSFLESALITNTHASDAVIIDIYEFKGQRIIGTTESSSDTSDAGDEYDDVRTPVINPDEDLVYESNINYSKPLSELNVIGDLTFYILKSVKIPKGASLFLDSTDLSYKDGIDIGVLFIKLDQSDSQVTVRAVEKLK